MAVPSASPAGATNNDPVAPSFDDEPPPYDDGDVPQDDEYPPDRFVPSRPAASVAVATVPPAGTATRTAARAAAAPVGGAARRGPAFAEKQRYGESVVREILGATFLEEQEHIPASRSRGD